VFPRSLVKRGAVKKLRAAGRVPAVVYGRHRPPQNLELDTKSIEKLMHHSASENILVELLMEAETPARWLALVQEVQHHALSGRILHVDFHEVAENEQVVVTVPLETAGEAIGVKEGGVLEHVQFKLRVRALPRDLPDRIIVDVTELKIGQSLHLGEIQPPPNVEILGDKKTSVISIAEPVTEVVEAVAEAPTEAGLEPEVIKEKKEGEEGEEGADKEGEKGAEKGAEKKEKGAEKKGEKKK